MKSNQIKLVSAGDMSADVVSSAIPLDQIFGLAIQAVYTGAPVGTLKLQASCDPFPKKANVSNGGPYNVTNWTDITLTSTAVAAAGNNLWNINGAFYNFIRVVYTFTSGTGSLDVNVVVKG